MHVRLNIQGLLIEWVGVWFRRRLSQPASLGEWILTRAGRAIAAGRRCSGREFFSCLGFVWFQSLGNIYLQHSDAAAIEANAMECWNTLASHTPDQSRIFIEKHIGDGKTGWSCQGSSRAINLGKVYCPVAAMTIFCSKMVGAVNSRGAAYRQSHTDLDLTFTLFVTFSKVSFIRWHRKAHCCGPH
jgi:hypothetical protein